MAQILKFETGKPEIVALKFDTGKLVDGRFGEQFLYSTTDDRQFYLDHDPAHDVEEQMRRLGIRAGVEFRIGKIKTSHGGCRWTVERVAGVQQDLRQRDTAFHDMPRKVTAGAPDNTPAAHAGVMSRNAQSRNGSDSTTLAEAPAAGPVKMTPSSLRFMAAYKDAIDVLIEQKAYAQTRGLALEIHCEDVRCLAATMMIDAQKSGAR